MLAGYCDQNKSFEITLNGYQARKIKENKKLDFDFQL